MKIAIFGPGAIGCLLGVKLAGAGENVVLVDYQAERAKRLRKSGITLIENGKETTAELDCSTAAPKDADLQIVAVKAYSTATLKLAENVPTLSLQNGLGNVETLCSMVGSAMVIAGVTSEGANMVEEGRVNHAGTGITKLGAWTSCPIEGAVATLRKAGFQVEQTESPGQTLWEKVAVNSGINPLTALLDVANGKLLEIAEARQLMRDLVVEAAKVSATEGYRFEYSLVETAEEVCSATATNLSSMVQDVRANKRTEIDAISGEILRRAQVAALPCPRTRVIYQLLRGLEQR